MEQTPKPKYATATSLTARHINRSVILNIIYANQPISRADTARITGLQRSTVSLIVDELLQDGWVVEGEYNRIPRGRRPIFLQINSEKAGLVGITITKTSVDLAVADLNGAIQWSGQETFAEYSFERFRNALRHLAEKAKHNHSLQLKGVGIALDDISDDDGNIQTAVADVFGVPVAMDSVTVACGKWFLIYHKDANIANGHLVSVNADANRIDLGVIIAGKPLRGAHGRAGSELSDDTSEHGSNENGSGATATTTATVTRTAQELANRLEFAVAAYDPGVVLLTGTLAADAGKVSAELEKRLRAVGAPDTALRIFDPANEEENLYVKGALAVILDHFLDNCPTN